VALQVVVVDPQRRYVSDLQLEDFSVFEEGVQQNVTLFAAGTSPLDLMLLIDTSASMFPRMRIVQEAAINFTRTLRDGDRASVVLFNNSIRVAQPFTDDTASLEQVIRRASPAGSTALYEAIYIGLREFARSLPGNDQLRRQALVVLTDGDDNESSISFEDVLAEAHRSAVTVFTIVPASPTPVQPILLPRPVSPFDMRTLADETGGRSFTPTRIEDLDGTYREIAEELSRQYWLAYVPAGGARGFRHVSVRVPSQPTLRARTRSGYYASAPDAPLAAPTGQDNE
jgi:VWFA-related protein